MYLIRSVKLFFSFFGHAPFKVASKYAFEMQIKHFVLKFWMETLNQWLKRLRMEFASELWKIFKCNSGGVEEVTWWTKEGGVKRTQPWGSSMTLCTECEGIESLYSLFLEGLSVIFIYGLHKMMHDCRLDAVTWCSSHLCICSLPTLCLVCLFSILSFMFRPPRC